MIAKYRKDGFPGEWWTTDFTMEQIENRLSALVQRENAMAEQDGKLVKAKEIIRDCVELNMSNYNEEDVSELNEAMKDLFALLVFQPANCADPDCCGHCYGPDQNDTASGGTAEG